jgi:hypothetical protein
VFVPSADTVAGRLGISVGLSAVGITGERRLTDRRVTSGRRSLDGFSRGR